MQIDLRHLDEMIAAGRLRQGAWGDGREQACLMSAVVNGAKSEADCAARGWPLWLAEIVVWMFDSYPEDDAVHRGRALMAAIAARPDANWDAVYRRVRLDAILPIAMESVGDGDEPWRVECRRVVQWSIDNGGERAWAARAALAAGSAEAAWADGVAWAAEAARAARAAGAARAARAAGAARAARAVGSAWAAEAAEARARARDRIESSLIAAIAEA